MSEAKVDMKEVMEVASGTQMEPAEVLNGEELCEKQDLGGNQVESADATVEESVNLSVKSQGNESPGCSFDYTTSSFIENVNSFCASIRVDDSLGSSF